MIGFAALVQEAFEWARAGTPTAGLALRAGVVVSPQLPSVRDVAEPTDLGQRPEGRRTGGGSKGVRIRCSQTFDQRLRVLSRRTTPFWGSSFQGVPRPCSRSPTVMSRA